MKEAPERAACSADEIEPAMGRGNKTGVENGPHFIFAGNCFLLKKKADGDCIPMDILLDYVFCRELA